MSKCLYKTKDRKHDQKVRDLIMYLLQEDSDLTTTALGSK